MIEPSACSISMRKLPDRLTSLTLIAQNTSWLGTNTTGRQITGFAQRAL